MGACSSSPAAVIATEPSSSRQPIAGSVLKKKGDDNNKNTRGVQFTNSTEQRLGEFAL